MFKKNVIKACLKRGVWVLLLSPLALSAQDAQTAPATTANTEQESEKSKTQDEVVVVGYGTAKKKDVTSAATVIGSKDFNKGLINSPEQLLQGRVSGVQISSASGEPGGEMSIRIRGVSTVRSNNNPLFVVDGVPLDGGSTQANFNGDNDANKGPVGDNAPARNPLNFLNPSDIDNISILKDAAATAIYGARGANGVVLITTKKGKSGSTGQLTLDVSAGISTVLKKYDLLGRDAFLTAARTALQKSGATVDANAFDKGFGVDGNRKGTFSTNWQDEILQVGTLQNYAIGYGSGNENSTYRLSLSYMDQQGILKGSGSNRLTSRINATHDMWDHKIKIETNVTAAQTNDQYSPVSSDAGYEGSAIGAMIMANPTAPVRNLFTSNGTIVPLYLREGAQLNDSKLTHEFYQPGNDQRNPVALINYIKDNGVTNRILGNIAFSVTPIKGLTYKFLVGYDASTSLRQSSINPNLNINGVSPTGVTVGGSTVYMGGSAYSMTKNSKSYVLTHTLTYQLKEGDHDLTALAGFEYNNYQRNGVNIRASQFINYDIAGADNFQNTYKDAASYLVYSYRSQNDIQSFFGRLNYSYADKYLISATLRQDGSSRFGQNNKYGVFPAVSAAWKVSNESFLPKNLFDDLKLRASWGVTGNQEFPGNVTQAIYSFDRASGGLTQQNNPNPDIKWEQTTTIDFGFDVALFGNRLYATFDYFNKATTNLLMQINYAQPAAATYIWQNLDATVTNKGFEFLVGGIPYTQGKFKWDASVNVTLLENKVTGYKGVTNTGTVSGQGLTGAYAQRIADGQPLNAFYLPTFTGFDANGYSTYANNGAYSFVGSPTPSALFGFTNTFSYDQLSLSCTFTGATGFYVYNNTANAYFTKGSLKNGRNVTADVASSTENPLNAPSASTRFLEKGDYLKLNNLTLSYRIDASKIIKQIKSVRVYVTGQNLLIFTKYTGIDPEINVNKAINGVPSSSMDYAAYPSSRSFLVGASFEL